jgi:hypothetical protein
MIESPPPHPCFRQPPCKCQDDFNDHEQHIPNVSGHLAEHRASPYDGGDHQAQEYYEENASAAFSLGEHRLPDCDQPRSLRICGSPCVLAAKRSIGKARLLAH